MNTAYGSDVAVEDIGPLVILTEAVSDYETALHYIQDDDGRYYVSVADIAGTLLGFAETLEAMGGLHKQIGDALNQIVPQIAQPFMDLDGVTPEATLHIFPGGPDADR